MGATQGDHLLKISLKALSQSPTAWEAELEVLNLEHSLKGCASEGKNKPGQAQTYNPFTSSMTGEDMMYMYELPASNTFFSQFHA